MTKTTARTIDELPDNRSWQSLLWACAALCVTLFVGTAPVTAQLGGPEDTVRRIMDEVGEQMKEIDRLLRESSRQTSQSSDPSQSAEQVRELVDQTRGSQETVVRGIDRLIEELNSMAQQSQSQSSSSQQQQDQQDQQQQQNQRQQGQREQTQTPDMVDQGQQQQGQNQPGQQQQQGQDPQDGERADQGGPDPQDMGRNREDGSVGENSTEEVENGGDRAEWGDLPEYVRFLHNRGGVPEVPSRYRRLHEAWLKRANQRNRERR